MVRPSSSSNISYKPNRRDIFQEAMFVYRFASFEDFAIDNRLA